MKKIHPIQKSIMKLAQKADLNDYKKSELVKMLGCNYQSQVDHHLNQLIKNHFLVLNEFGRLVPKDKMSGKLLSIPIMGQADCGEATKFADNFIDDYLTISPSLLNTDYNKIDYGLIAKGDSMNRAIINNKNIEDGDCVLIQKIENYQPKKNDIVVSVVNNMANIKRFDFKNQMIYLKPDSSYEYFMPIILTPDDCVIVGKVVDIIKKA